MVLVLDCRFPPGHQGSRRWPPRCFAPPPETSHDHDEAELPRERQPRLWRATEVNEIAQNCPPRKEVHRFIPQGPGMEHPIRKGKGRRELQTKKWKRPAHGLLQPHRRSLFEIFSREAPDYLFFTGMA